MNCFNINIKDNQGLYNSPVRQPFDKFVNTEDREISNKHGNPKFNIRPFSLECSTATTTSHSTRRPESHEKSNEKDQNADYLKFTTSNIPEICHKDNTPKSIAPLKDIQEKVKCEPLKIKINNRNTNINRIKLKFKRTNNPLKLKNLANNLSKTETSNKKASDIKDMTSSLNMSKIFNYPTKGNLRPVVNNKKNMDTIVPQEENVADCKDGAMFKEDELISTPRKTAYFGK